MSPLSPVKEQHTPAPSKVTGDRYLTALHSSRNDIRKLLVVLQTHAFSSHLRKCAKETVVAFAY
jgi:hypothetical protein